MRKRTGTSLSPRPVRRPAPSSSQATTRPTSTPTVLKKGFTHDHRQRRRQTAQPRLLQPRNINERRRNFESGCDRPVALVFGSRRCEPRRPPRRIYVPRYRRLRHRHDDPALRAGAHHPVSAGVVVRPAAASLGHDACPAIHRRRLPRVECYPRRAARHVRPEGRLRRHLRGHYGARAGRRLPPCARPGSTACCSWRGTSLA